MSSWRLHVEKTRQLCSFDDPRIMSQRAFSGRLWALQNVEKMKVTRTASKNSASQFAAHLVVQGKGLSCSRGGDRCCVGCSVCSSSLIAPSVLHSSGNSNNQTEKPPKKQGKKQLTLICMISVQSHIFKITKVTIPLSFARS